MMEVKGLVITKELIAQHNMTDEEYKRIFGILGREPNFTELGMFSVMWSERQFWIENGSIYDSH